MVAAVGGGIHSGAWEVEVLTRLHELMDNDVRVCEKLPDEIRALSGVSGGAYGAMLYAHAMYPYHKPRTADDLETLRAVTQSSSLSAVVGALTYHDLAGYCIPVFWGRDRGAAMEQAWVNNASRAGMGEGPRRRHLRFMGRTCRQIRNACRALHLGHRRERTAGHFRFLGCGRLEFQRASQGDIPTNRLTPASLRSPLK